MSQCEDGHIKLSEALDRPVAGVDHRLPDLQEENFNFQPNIFFPSLDHQVWGSTAVGSLTLGSTSLTAIVRMEAVVSCGEVVLAQGDLLEAGSDAVSRSENMTGGDQNSSTAPALQW